VHLHPAFRSHFEQPRGHGGLPGATHRGAHEDAACGDALEVELRIERGCVVAAGYRVRGCSGSIAAASALATLLPGRAADPAAVSRSELEAELGAVPVGKRHSLRLALAAYAAALAGPLDPEPGPNRP
jgi:NifU-like protein involved in Fe-S cluster formation